MVVLVARTVVSRVKSQNIRSRTRSEGRRGPRSTVHGRHGARVKSPHCVTNSTMMSWMMFRRGTLTKRDAGDAGTPLQLWVIQLWVICWRLGGSEVWGGVRIPTRVLPRQLMHDTRGYIICAHQTNAILFRSAQCEECRSIPGERALCT